MGNLDVHLYCKLLLKIILSEKSRIEETSLLEPGALTLVHVEHLLKFFKSCQISLSCMVSKDLDTTNSLLI